MSPPRTPPTILSVLPLCLLVAVWLAAAKAAAVEVDRGDDEDDCLVAPPAGVVLVSGLLITGMESVVEGSAGIGDVGVADSAVCTSGAALLPPVVLVSLLVDDADDSVVLEDV